MQAIHYDQTVSFKMTHDQVKAIASLVDMFEEDVPAKEFFGSLFEKELEETHKFLRSVVSSMTKSN